jgi:predicted dehydrogenase
MILHGASVDGNRVVTVLLAGIGGYGKLYVDGLLDQGPAHGVRLIAAADPFAAGQPSAARLAAAGVPCFDSLALALERHRPDLVVLSTPIHHHAADSILALESGCHVLCEKPAAGCLADAEAMASATRRTGRFLAIGYQWSFSACIRTIKQRIRAGDFGQPLRFATKVCWPRPWSYYQRNRWAGAIRSREGGVVNDSPVNNATAHYLHNMLFLLGATAGASAETTAVTAKAWRAYPIENFDTAALRADTAGRVPVYFYTSHAVEVSAGPDSVFEFEGGWVRYDRTDGHFRWTGQDGVTTDLGSPDAEGPLDKLWQCAEACRTGQEPALGISGALAHARVVEAVQAVAGGIITVPPDRLERRDLPDGDHQLSIRGLAPAFDHAFAGWSLPELS